MGYTEKTVLGQHCLVTDYFSGAMPKNPNGTAPGVFALGQNYPNPFNPSTNIEFAVPVDTRVKLSVYNSLGAQIATLVDESLKAGVYVAPFDASQLPSGTYSYRIVTGEFTQTRQMVLAK